MRNSYGYFLIFFTANICMSQQMTTEAGGYSFRPTVVMENMFRYFGTGQFTFANPSQILGMEFEDQSGISLKDFDPEFKDHVFEHILKLSNFGVRQAEKESEKKTIHYLRSLFSSSSCKDRLPSRIQ